MNSVTSIVKLSIANHWLFGLALIMTRFFALDMFRVEVASLTGVSVDDLRKLHGLATLAVVGLTVMLTLEKIYLLVFKVKRPVIQNPVVKGTIEKHFLMFIWATVFLFLPHPYFNIIGEWIMVLYAPILALEKFLCLNSRASGKKENAGANSQDKRKQS